MILNDKPCNECRNYDPIRNGTSGGKPRFAVRGWCTVKSAYPFREQEGQLFPIGVKRVGPGELAQPHIVVGTEVQTHCSQFTPKL